MLQKIDRYNFYSYIKKLHSFDLIGQTDSDCIFLLQVVGAILNFIEGQMGSDCREGRCLLEDCGFSEPWGGRSNCLSAIPGDFELYECPTDFHLADAFGLNGSWDGFSTAMRTLTLSRVVLPVPEPKTIIMLSVGMVIGSFCSVKRKSAKLYL